jgi:hypothetical protein
MKLIKAVLYFVIALGVVLSLSKDPPLIEEKHQGFFDRVDHNEIKEEKKITFLTSMFNNHRNYLVKGAFKEMNNLKKNKITI